MEATCSRISTTNANRGRCGSRRPVRQT
jgi:hypothetical protein